MSRGPDAGMQLERALIAAAAAQGLALIVAAADATPWASATFTGARHLITLALPDTPTACAWLDGLGEAEFVLRRHLVADCVVVARAPIGAGLAVTIEALTIAS